jgi:hypothetical protein
MTTAKAKKDVIYNNTVISNNNLHYSIKPTKIKIYDTDSIKVKYKNIDSKNIKILVLSLLKDSDLYVEYIDNFISRLLAVFPQSQFSFFTNNSDKNDFALPLLVSKYKNLQIIKYENELIYNNNRITKFAEYRNLNFQRAVETLGTNFDYVIIFDSDLIDNIPVDGIVKSLSIDYNWSCISANCTYNNSNFHYDELALRLKNDSKNICDLHPNFRQYYGISQRWLNSYRIFNEWTEVDSAFGCLSIYKMKELLDIYNEHNQLYDLSNYPEFTAEHITLNDKLPNAKLISPFISYFNKTKLEDRNMNISAAFVPRDAGFFSVFNFYIGSLSQGLKCYPLWNKNELLNIHRENKHFAYWTENFNCWFDYFEPVSFFPGDNTHTNNEYLNLPRYCGEHGPDEFRLPAVTKDLLKGDKERFKQWRKDIHNIYKTFVKFNPEILNQVDEIWVKVFSNSHNNIGVHYRHPSHFIESGKIYLEDYFSQIDSILQKYPDSKIFLASDSQFGIYSFVERYKDKVFYIDDVDRLSMAEFLHWSFGLADGKADTVGFINGKGYELHHKRVDKSDNKKMTIDLLKEILCLSRCNQIINNISNIPLAISYINPEVEIITL